jgi:hypothetical protein
VTRSSVGIAPPGSGVSWGRGAAVRLLRGVARSEPKDISGVILTKPFDVDRLLGVVAEHWNV